MASTIPSSTNTISPTPGIAFITKNAFLSKCSFPRKLNKQPLPSQKCILPFSTSLRLFPQFLIGSNPKPKQRTIITSATETDIALEEPDLSQADKEALDTSEESSAKSDVGSTQSKRSRPIRKSDMPPVKNEELIPGATFTGKVKSIQPFGAFVDFGAFTDGLVHVSQLSNSFVKDVASVVTVGQEVKVRLVEVNMESKRISLTMRENDATSKSQQQKDDKSRPPRKGNQKKEDIKPSKFVKGQDLDGTVKNTTRSGAFISLPEGEEGFLPTSEEADEGFVSMMGGSSLEIGQEVKVRVLRINRGKVTLTMKKEEAGGELDAKLSQGVVHSATNPFLLAFRSNKVISDFLDERQNKNGIVEKTEEDLSTVATDLGNDDEIESVKEVESSDGQVIEEPSPIEAKENDETVISSQVADLSSETVDKATEEAVDVTLEAEANTSESSEKPLSVNATEKTEEQVVSGELTERTLSDVTEEVIEKTDNVIIAKDEDQSEKPEEAAAPNLEETVISCQVADLSSETVDKATEEAVDVTVEAEANTSESSEEPLSVDATEKTEEQVVSGESTERTLSDVTEEVIEKTDNEIIAKDEDQSEKPEEAAAPNLEESISIESSTTESQVPVEDIENKESGVAVNEVEIQTPAGSQEKENLSESSESGDASPKETTTKATISPALVNQLRDETGAGMMDCKKALAETEGDIVKAQEYLRKKGLASADKKSSRVTAEGRIGSYIHDSRIGVLIEVNCETDFVARGDIFKELVEDLAMQVAACPQVQYLSTDDIPKEIVNKEKELEMQKEDLLSKPEQMRERIVDGRIRKRMEEIALLEQPFIKNDKVVVKDWVKQTISTIGENIKVKRFVRYNLGEGLEKKSQDFAAEVAAQTAAKPTATAVVQEPVATETKESVEKPPTVVVSASLVKQLRDETGAGMMDCKKALAETGGDLEKAQEYLRKKGLSTADKKSSRLAAEGRIGSYIHDSRIGVLIEVNCETDFVGRSENFKQLVDDLAMQVVACPQVQYVSIEDIPESIVKKEKQLEKQRKDLQSKPENIREKIVDGRIGKRLGEMALLEQTFIKDDSLLVKDLVKQTIAGLGENVKVRRFVRFTLGESSNEEMVTEAQAE